MRVTGIERFLVDLPFRKVAERNMARSHTSQHIVEILRVETDSGIVGYGETVQGRAPEASLKRAVGGNPFELMWDDGLGFGVQLAMLDLAAKAAEVPAYRLLGRKVRDWCPITWWSIDMSAEDFAAEARLAVEMGYTSQKQKTRPWWDVRAAMAATCSAVPDHYQLTLDFNMLLVNSGAASSVVTELDAYPNVAIYESPIPQGDVAGNRRVRTQTRCAIAMHYGAPPIMTALQEDVCDGFVVGGGASSVLRQAAILQEANKPFFLEIVGAGLTTAFTAHLAAVCTHAQWPAVTCLNLYEHQLLAEPLVVEGGYCRVPERPGLGVEPDEGALARYRTDRPEHQVLRAIYSVVRPNGQITWYAGEDGPGGYRPDALAGNRPVFEPGVRLETWADDGSREWADLHARVQVGPVR